MSPAVTAVLTFAQLVDEEPAFIERLAKMDLWARWAHDDPVEPKFPAASVAAFIAQHARAIATEGGRVLEAIRRHGAAWEQARATGCLDPIPNEATTGGAELHVGVEATIRSPRFHDVIVEQGGMVKPAAGFHSGTVVGATRVTKRSAWTSNPFLLYTRPRVDDGGNLVQSNLVLDPYYLDEDHTVRRHAEEVLVPLARAVAWMRRRTRQHVPLVGVSYTTRATDAVAQACAAGMRIRFG